MDRQSHAIRRTMRVMVVAAVAVIPFVVGVPAAFAGVGFGVTPTFPTGVTVGQTGLPASIQVSNTSSPPESTGNVSISTVNLVPACGVSTFVGNGDCPAASADPGVFQLSATGAGGSGTACVGKTFTITILNAATGQVTFTPSGGAIILTPPLTANSICRIDFTFNVLKAPVHPSGTGSPPSTSQIGYAIGTAAVNENTGIGIGSSSLTVTTPPPATTTTTSPATSTTAPPTTTRPATTVAGSTTTQPRLALTGERVAMPLALAAGLMLIVLGARHLRRRSDS